VSGEPIRLAVLGYPLHYTRSPELHRAGAAAVGLRAESLALPTEPDSLGRRLAELAGDGYLGCNLTNPLKGVAEPHLARVSPAARRSCSVNTVGFAAEGAWGETTDGRGFVHWLRSLGRAPERERAVLLGAGGAARSLALALADEGAGSIVVSTRRPASWRDAWHDIPAARFVNRRTPEEAASLAECTLVVNATPLESPVEIVALETVERSALVVDLRYGDEITPWVARARSLGRQAYDGLGLLVYQARESLAMWTGRDVPVEPLAQAVGWPR
jgi:shikimate dehydrogenase